MAKFVDTSLDDKNKTLSEVNDKIALVQKDHFKHLQKINRSVLENKVKNEKKINKQTLIILTAICIQTVLILYAIRFL